MLPPIAAACSRERLLAGAAGGWGAADHAYSAGRYILKPDEPRVIEGRLHTEVVDIARPGSGT